MSDTEQILVFTIGEGEYCIPIEYVAEIVEVTEIRSVPNTEPHVEGVTSLRGQTTTMINPAVVLDAEMNPGELRPSNTDGKAIVFDSDALDNESQIGWLVSTINNVEKTDEKELDVGVGSDSPVIRGVLKNDERNGFTVWLDPHNLTE